MSHSPVLVCRCCGSRFVAPRWMSPARPTCEWCRKVARPEVLARIARFGADHALPKEVR